MPDLTALLDEYAQLSPKPLTLGQIVRFYGAVAALKNDALMCQPARHPASIAPQFLPPSAEVWLSQVTKIPQPLIGKCWTLFGDMIWHDREDIASLISLDNNEYHRWGINGGYTQHVFYPPSHYCSTEGCPSNEENGRRLTKAEQRKVIFFTLDKGPLPAHSVHLYCTHCLINYHHNFSVNAGIRTYYQGIPDVLQIGEHQFVERKLINIWINLMVIAWTSATNCARFYNISLARGVEAPPTWHKFALTGDEVWDAFIILSLMEDCEARDQALIVPHTGDRKDRFTAAVRARNLRISLYGQEAILHYCDKCVRRYESGRKVSAVVIDGVTIGHPVCASPNCHIPLANNRHRFCPTHREQEQVCSIIGCDLPVMPGKRACASLEHTEVERIHTERGKAHFQLKERLVRARVAHPNDTLPPADTEPDDLEDVDEETNEFTLPSTSAATRDEPADVQPKRIRAQFGRKRSHNEQVIVAPCGMIHARATFYFSEAISSVAELIRRTYAVPGLMPDHIIFDNNCSLSKHVQHDEAFKNVGLSVDVFHFKSKHSERDLYCETHCNPAAFPELLKGDGGWYFNSSIAEQTNVWIGSYHSICREMLVDKYNFFLDEIIRRRNIMTNEKLEKEGHHPGYYSRHS